MSILIINASQATPTRVETISNALVSYANTKNISSQQLHLYDYPLPLCDGRASFSHPHVAPITKIIEESQGIIICSAVYNYTLTSAVKTLIEHTGKAWNDKVVGFALCAGGEKSYMAAMSVATSLMLDFRCYIVPRFVYLLSEDVEKDNITHPAAVDRLHQLLNETSRVATALA